MRIRGSEDYVLQNKRYIFLSLAIPKSKPLRQYRMKKTSSVENFVTPTIYFNYYYIRFSKKSVKCESSQHTKDSGSCALTITSRCEEVFRGTLIVKGIENALIFARILIHYNISYAMANLIKIGLRSGQIGQ
ncbi:unnamed protein product, partial [Brenthis ino]